MSASAGAVRYAREAAVVTLTFDRPSARNALTEVMYAELEAGLDRAVEEGDVRIVVLRGAGGAFVAGTDITRFTEFRSGDDGVRYEQRIDHVVGRVESLPIPTLAVVDGYAAGAGLLIAAACDLRVCTPAARFGAPIARTVGNCLSMANTARLLGHFGVARTKALLFMAEFMGAKEAHDAGFVLEIIERDHVDARVDALCARLAAHAPLTLQATKEAIRRLVAAGLPPGEDLIRLVYGSADFHEGVAAFLGAREPSWKGR